MTVNHRLPIILLLSVIASLPLSGCLPMMLPMMGVMGGHGATKDDRHPENPPTPGGSNKTACPCNDPNCPPAGCS